MKLSNQEKLQALSGILFKIENGMSSEEIQAELRALLLRDTEDGKLYKYRAVGKHALDSLETQTLHCSKPSAFNDPFDCRIGVDLQSLTEAQYGKEFAGIDEQLDMLLKCVDGTMGLEDCPDESMAVIQEWLCNRNIQELLEKAKAGAYPTPESRSQFLLTHFDIVVDILRPILENSKLKSFLPATEQFYPKMLEKMTPDAVMRLSGEPFSLSAFAKAAQIEADTDEIGLMVELNNHLKLVSNDKVDHADASMTNLSKQLAKMLDDTFFIGCLCTSNKNRLMWSHYADSHKGFCVEYDFSLAPDDSLPLPVVYSKKRPLTPWDAAINESEETLKAADRAFVMTLLTKDEAWAYEHEWRLIVPLSGSQDFDMPPISCIYLGALCPPESKAAIMEIAARKSIPVKQMVVDRGEYELHCREC